MEGVNDAGYFFIGDIRDYDAVSDSCKQIDYVFHASFKTSTIL